MRQVMPFNLLIISKKLIIRYILIYFIHSSYLILSIFLILIDILKGHLYLFSYSD